MPRKRKPTVCQACFYPSYNGRVCRECIKFYGGPPENAIAGAEQARRLMLMTYDEVCEFMAGLVDVIVPDFPNGLYLPRLIHSNTKGSAPPIGGADQSHLS